MKYAIVEQGGKQYKAVEGEVLEVDRLPEEEGKEISLEGILLLADGDDLRVGTPVLGGLEVRAKVVRHFSGPKLTWFRYSPKKRIRIRGGHRQHYTRLLVEHIGGKDGGGSPSKTADGATANESAPPPAKKATAKRAATKKSSGATPAKKKSTSKSRK